MSDRVCVFGEVLFDHFPDGRRVLGGAPFNVAWHLQAFGRQPFFVSRVGDDPEGAAVRAAMQAWGMDTGGLQTDSILATGRVNVTFSHGEPSYDIVEPCAYDTIEAPQAADCGLLYHGSLAMRGDASRAAARQLRDSHPGQVFLDVNLRPPWWRRDQVLAMVRQADWVKLNTDELGLLYASEGDPEAFLAEHRLTGLVLTHGSAGAEVFTAQGERHRVRPTAPTAVVDTVGAGDAFASVMMLGLLVGWPLDLTAQRAQLFASALVGQRGATVSDPAFYRPFIDDWKL